MLNVVCRSAEQMTTA